MRFGLERMRRLLTALGSPQERFSAVHVVGTNGKSSTVRMTAALLEAHGTRAGAFLSPHLTSFAERIRIGDEDLAPGAFGAAVQRAAAAAAKVDRTLAGGDRVTQFELLTAAAFDELARRGVEVAVVEAGLGGRHDATGVLRAPVVVLTNVGLEHTRWLGPDGGRHRAREAGGGGRRARRSCSARWTRTCSRSPRRPGATIVRPEPPRRRAAGGRLPRASSARTSRVARAAARAVLGPLDEERVAAVAGSIQVPGRLQVVGERPLCILDGAHNPSGVAALAAALPERPFTAVVSILDDKDAGAMLAALRPRCARFVCTAAPTPRALPPATLASLAAQLGGEAEVVPDPHAALARARALAGPGRRGRGHGLHLPRRRPRLGGAPAGVRAVNDRGPSVLGMVALVAVVVALTILVFFALGYALGRAFF